MSSQAFTTRYIVLSKTEVAKKQQAFMRELFSAPVRVTVLEATRRPEIVYVYEHHRGIIYPCDPKHLKTDLALTNKQRAAIN